MLPSDANTRQDATQKLDHASRENYVSAFDSSHFHLSLNVSAIGQPQYMLMLSAELVNENSPLHVRNAAGLALKNALTARVRHCFLRYILLAHLSMKS